MGGEEEEEEEEEEGNKTFTDEGVINVWFSMQVIHRHEQKTTLFSSTEMQHEVSFTEAL